MFRTHCIITALFFAFFGVSWGAEGDTRLQNTEHRISTVEKRVSELEKEVRSAAGAAGGAAFLCGAFCALWAQNTNRNAWLWFFLGLLFNIFTVIILLSKNSGDIDRRRRAGQREFSLQDFRQQ